MGYTTVPAFITSDYQQRLGSHNASHDDSFLMTTLPEGDPATWLQPYLPGTQCVWELQAPAGALITLNIRYVCAALTA